MGFSTFKPKVHEPKSFDGAISYNELEKKFWDMEQYFNVAKINAVE